MNFSILSLKHCFLNNVHLQSSICVTEFESCQIFRGDIWLTLVTYQQTGSSNWIKIVLLSFHGSLPWFQRCRALSASGLFQKQLLWDSTCYFHAEQDDGAGGGCTSLQANPNTHTTTHTTHTHFYNPECIQCPNWYYNPAEGGGIRKRDCVKVMSLSRFPLFIVNINSNSVTLYTITSLKEFCMR